ncbi:MAG: hypothetical protein QF922_05900, partial [SAR324 cluster bacterium]|nr:hypothetical protein [SAR324 cluster bacterium]
LGPQPAIPPSTNPETMILQKFFMAISSRGFTLFQETTFTIERRTQKAKEIVMETCGQRA